jgi:hypothetical protein
MITREFSHIAAALFVVAPCLAACSHSSGEQAPPAAAAPAPETSTMTQTQGGYTSPEDVRIVSVKVEDVDRENHSVTFKAHVMPEANIERNGRNIRLDDLQKGDSLKMFVDTRTGEVVRMDVTQMGAQ